MNKKRTAVHRKLAAVLTGALAVAGILPQHAVWAEMARPNSFYEAEKGEAEEFAETKKELHIRTEAELIQFVRRCSTEVYSKGLYVVLKNDLNLASYKEEFQPAALFAGTFDGGGHSIKGLAFHGKGSNVGLFRYVAVEAVIKDLHVYGTIMPSGSRKNIGGIAGTNQGIIDNCTFSGEIMAQEALGGIAGYNGLDGVIRNSCNHGFLTGNLKTGGIVGFNEGQISGCENRGEVNTSDIGVTEEEGQLSMSSVDLEENVRTEKVHDAGGIAGLSLGTITDCENYGSIGYPHKGYNVGGIAGRQSGLISECRNYGAVQGRKDAGGITGQFEPFVTVRYEEDTADKLEKQLNELSDMSRELSGSIENAGDTATNDLDQVGDRVKIIREIGDFYKDVLREDNNNFNRNTDTSLDEIDEMLGSLDLKLVGSESERRITDAGVQTGKIRECQKKLTPFDVTILVDPDANKAKLLGWLNNQYQVLSEMLGYANKLNEDVEYLLLHVPGEVKQGGKNFESDLEDIQVETSVLKDNITYHRDKAKDDLDGMDEELSEQADLLTEEVDALSDNLKSNRNQIRAQKNQIEDQIDQIRDTMSEGVDRAREDADKELYEDISDLEDGELTEGMVDACQNTGKIMADYQAGGIVGIIGAEVSLDPEQDLSSDEERTLNITRNAKAVVSNCANEGDIVTKKDYAGGIAGKANLGALIGNQNYGDVGSEDGSYIGGITGSSDSVLRKNYSMCSLEGNDYLGGIAGWGKEIIDNYAMSMFLNTEGEWIGSIVGALEEESTASGNYYVDEGIGAVDGVTYETQAAGLSYEEFKSMEQVPERFGHLTVSFLVEDQVIKSLRCDYGTAVRQEDIPQAPQKEGYYYEWEEKDLSCIKGNEKVHAVYKAWNTTIASSEDKMPAMLVEADFYPGTTLNLAEWSCDQLQVPETFRVIKGYTCSIIPPQSVELPEKMTVHVLAENCPKNTVAGLWRDGNLQLADSRWDGPYLIFEMDGPGELVLLKPRRDMTPWFKLAAAAVILVAAAAMVKKRRSFLACMKKHRSTGRRKK